MVRERSGDCCSGIGCPEARLELDDDELHHQLVVHLVAVLLDLVKPGFEFLHSHGFAPSQGLHVRCCCSRQCAAVRVELPHDSHQGGEIAVEGSSTFFKKV